MKSGAKEIQARFDERSAIVRDVRPLVQAVFLRYLRFGNERIFVGPNGWQFFDGDVLHLISERPAPWFSGDPRKVILEFRAAMAKRGIALLVVPVPPKPSIHPKELASSAGDGPIRRAGEQEFLLGLEAEGIQVLDLANHFESLARKKPLYLARDTHWRPEAMEIAARAIADRVRALVELPETAQVEVSEEVKEAIVDGDAVRMLDLPTSQSLVPPEKVSIRLVKTSQPTSGLLPGHPAVLVLGDSFAGMYNWLGPCNLVSRLEFHLGTLVDDILLGAGGPSGTRLLLSQQLQADAHRLDGVRIVVWEFASRELSRNAWYSYSFDDGSQELGIGSEKLPGAVSP